MEYHSKSKHYITQHSKIDNITENSVTATYRDSEDEPDEKILKNYDEFIF